MADGVAIWKWMKVGNLLLICMSEGRLRDDDFEPCLELHRTNEVTRAISWALGNVSMTPVQRKKASDAMGDHPTANITDSSVSRGIITALAWMGRPWKAFASKDIVRAVDHVGVPAGHTSGDIVELLNRLKREVEREAGAG